MAKLLSVQAGQVETLQPVAGELSDKPWRTAFFKRPVEGTVRVTRLGVQGDAQAEEGIHGGHDKALCVYSAEHLSHWRDELGREPPAPAAFGENFTVEGLVETEVCLGDVWRVGSAEVQVSQPRQPCWKLARRWGVKDFVVRVQRTGLTGWYLRVLAEGDVTAGDPIALADRPLPDWPLSRCNEVMHHRKEDRDAAAELAAIGPLSASWKEQLRERLG